jgi:hypothetical protein
MLEVPQSMLDERRLLDLDKRDEMWDGELHMVPPPKDAHQVLAARFFPIVASLAAKRGLEALYESGLFRTDRDYRIPDVLVRRPDQASERGSEGAQLVVEFRSSGDESYRKLGFYAALGVREALVVHPDDRRAELFRLVEHDLRPVSPDPTAGLHCEVLDVWLTTVEGKLRIAWADGSAEV